MKITVDTTKDSKEDIRKAIELLSRFTESESCEPKPQENPVSGTENIFNMFNQDNEKTEEEASEPQVVTY